ncbi:MAG TPA: CoA protein activase [Moorella mulderi]|nr:CoA protein activase [Moorella mulderi]
MRKVTFPHMGYSHIAFKQLIEDMGFEAITPCHPNRYTLDLGVRYSPEHACIPFKILMGNYIEALERGAEIIITSGGVGPCRAGLYGMTHEKILKSLGYDFRIVVFDPPLVNLWDFYWKLRFMVREARLSWRAFIDVIKRAWDKLKLLDEMEIKAINLRPYEVEKGSTTRAFHQCLQIIDRARTRKEMEEARRECHRILEKVPKDRSRRPLKVGLVGEIYCLLEPFINLEVERTLGELGALACRGVFLTGYTQTDVLGKGNHNVRLLAAPYLNQFVGGHGQNSVGETIFYAKKGFDGVIHVAPFGCLPEIVAKGVLPKISRDLDIPILTLTLDEQTGRAGVQTRLEAFVDLLYQKRRAKEVKGFGTLLPGYRCGLCQH